MRSKLGIAWQGIAGKLSLLSQVVLGGSSSVRDVRFTSTVRKALYERLLAVGQVKKVALTACRHTFVTMLNAMLKHRTPWQPQEVQS